MLRDLRCAGGEGAPREGHDFARLGEGAPSAFRGGGGLAHAEAANAVGEGRGRFSGIRNRKGLRTPHPRTEPRSGPPIFVPPLPAEPEGAPPAPRSRSAPLTCGHRCMRGASSPRSRVGWGREGGPYSHPPGLPPPPAASAAAAGALCCNARAATEPARAPVASVTATPPGAAQRAAVHILSPAPSPGAAPQAQPRGGAAEAGGCVAAVTRYAGPPQETRVAEGGREVRPPNGSGGRGCSLESSLWSPRVLSRPPRQRSDLRWGEETVLLPDPSPSKFTISPHQSQLCTVALLVLP